MTEGENTFAEFDVLLWQKALALNEKAEREGEALSRQKVAEALSTGERLGAYINFALANRNILNCLHEQVVTSDNDRELFMCDLHFPYQDKAAIDIMLRYAKQEVDPTIIVIDGDLLDFYQVSNFTKNPLRSKRIFEEIREVHDFLCMLRDMFPNAVIKYKTGNHEDRLERYILEKAPQLAELVESLLPEKLQLAKLKIDYIKEPFPVGKLWHLHGHEKPGGAYNPEHILNMLIQYIGDHFITAHYHRTQSKTFKRIGNRYWNTYSVGYLAGDLDYAVLNKWQQGFAVITYDNDGNFKVDNKTILNGIIY